MLKAVQAHSYFGYYMTEFTREDSTCLGLRNSRVQEPMRTATFRLRRHIRHVIHNGQRANSKEMGNCVNHQPCVKQNRQQLCRDPYDPADNECDKSPASSAAEKKKHKNGTIHSQARPCE